MMLDLNEAERWEQAQVTAAAEAREATNRRRLTAVAIVFTCIVLLVGKSAVPRRPDGPRHRQLFGFGNKDDMCDGVVCLNGGDCNSNTGRCVCPTGFTGDSCEIDNSVKDPCEGAVCLNGGECDPNTLTCICPTGFTGAQCQDAVPGKCDGVTCLNGGLCNTNTGLCACPTGFSGDQCQDKDVVPDKCDGVTCLNGGACDSNTGLCVCPPGFTGVQCQTPVPNPGVKTVFITKNKWNGNLGGLAGADDKCQVAADAEDLDGTFKAWLSDGSHSAASRLTHSSHAYVLPKNGATVANDWADLVSVPLDNLINRNEKGNIAADLVVWTGTDEHGNQHLGHCLDWESSDSAEKGLAGRNKFKSDDWTDNDEKNCNVKRHLYCFEQ